MTILDDATSDTAPSPGATSRGLDRRRFGTLVLAAGVGSWFPRRLALALPASEEARVIDFEWVDTARDRAVPVITQVLARVGFR